MALVHEILRGSTIGLINAHPDDHLIHSKLVRAALEVGAQVHEATLTLGKAGKDRRTDHRDFVRDGGRVKENDNAAHHLGIASVRYHDGRDGGLRFQTNKFVSPLADWVEELELDFAVSSGDLADHRDHRAAAKIVTNVLGKLAYEERRVPHLLQLTTRTPFGGIEVAPDPTAIRMTFEAARHHPSQFSVTDPVSQPTWPIIEGLAVHPDTLRGLDQYPIRTPAYYQFIAGQLPYMAEAEPYAILEGVS